MTKFEEWVHEYNPMIFKINKVDYGNMKLAYEAGHKAGVDEVISRMPSDEYIRMLMIGMPTTRDGFYGYHNVFNLCIGLRDQLSKGDGK